MTKIQRKRAKAIWRVTFKVLAGKERKEVTMEWVVPADDEVEACDKAEKRFYGAGTYDLRITQKLEVKKVRDIPLRPLRDCTPSPAP